MKKCSGCRLWDLKSIVAKAMCKLQICWELLSLNWCGYSGTGTEVVQNWFVVEGTAKHKGWVSWAVLEHLYLHSFWRQNIKSALNSSLKIRKLFLLSDQQVTWARLLRLNHKFRVGVVGTVSILSQERVKIWEEPPPPNQTCPVLQCFVPWHFSPWFSLFSRHQDATCFGNSLC